MGKCLSKKEFNTENFKNTSVKQYEGSYINNNKNGFCIEY